MPVWSCCAQLGARLYKRAATVPETTIFMCLKPNKDTGRSCMIDLHMLCAGHASVLQGSSGPTSIQFTACNVTVTHILRLQLQETV